MDKITALTPIPQNADYTVTKTVVSSTGDPHISAAEYDGDKVVGSVKYNDQQGIGDLVDSTGLGGVNVATQTTAVNKKGVAYNQAVEIYDASARVTVKIYDTTGKGGEIEENVEIDQDADGGFQGKVPAAPPPATPPPSGDDGAFQGKVPATPAPAAPSPATPPPSGSDGGFQGTVKITDNAKGTVTVKISDGDESFNVSVSQGKQGLNVTATAKNVAVGGAAIGTLISASA
jgi:hypothetical protein